jgi:hypothetical protein
VCPPEPPEQRGDKEPERDDEQAIRRIEEAAQLNRLAEHGGLRHRLRVSAPDKIGKIGE